MERHDVLWLFGRQEFLRELERTRDIALGKAECELADLLGTGPCPDCPSFALTACCAAVTKVSNASLACSTLFSARTRMSDAKSKRAPSSFAMT